MGDDERVARDPATVPSPGLIKRLWGLAVVRTLAIFVLGAAIFFGMLIAVGVVFWASLDAGNAREQDVLGLRPECGIGDDAFAEPTSAEGEGFQEKTYTFRYAQQPASWVDGNVVVRFGPDLAVDDLPVLEDVPVRKAGNVNYGGPPLTDESGAVLVWSSPLGRSELGSTTFDVYRHNDRYDVVVECNNSGGLNGAMAEAAVPTSAP